MKKTLINGFALCAILLGTFIGGQYVERLSWYDQQHSMYTKLEAYRSYVTSTEHMLDLLNQQYNWVDGLDHDGYYESRVEVFHLDSVALTYEQARQEYCFEMNKKFNQ